VAVRLQLDGSAAALRTSEARATTLENKLQQVAQALARYLRGSAMATQKQLLEQALKAGRGEAAANSVAFCMSCGAPMPGEVLVNLVQDYRGLPVPQEPKQDPGKQDRPSSPTDAEADGEACGLLSSLPSQSPGPELRLLRSPSLGALSGRASSAASGRTSPSGGSPNPPARRGLRSASSSPFSASPKGSRASLMPPLSPMPPASPGRRPSSPTSPAPTARSKSQQGRRRPAARAEPPIALVTEGQAWSPRSGSPSAPQLSPTRPSPLPKPASAIAHGHAGLRIAIPARTLGSSPPTPGRRPSP
jgi:hypothetical protein